jgi:ABC-type branched-subunit amino acid transport system ATPase component/ABC-type branched-subunit amino acid transport system permease subunit
VLATWVTQQLAFDGIVSGLVFGLLAMGVVLVYRATRVINFAVGNLGLVGVGLFVLLSEQYDVPFWLAAVAGLAAGTVWGGVVELAVIRRLFDAPRVIVLVATIGIAQLSLAVLAAYPSVDARGATFPVPIGSDLQLGDITASGAQLTILVVVPVVALALSLFLNRTTLGRTVKASASNQDLARLVGISPKIVSTFVWATAGFLATISLSLVAAQGGSVQSLDVLGSSTLVRALAAAVIAGMVSFPRALLAGVAIGLAQALVQFNWLDSAGLFDFLLFIAVLVAVFVQSRSGVGEAQTFAFTPKPRPVPARLRGLWWVRTLDRSGLVVLGIGAAVLPLIVTQTSRHLLYTTIIGFAVCALSVTVLTGWAGQLSLGQMAFAGIGAFLTAGFQRGMTMNVGWGETRIVNAGLAPLTFATSATLAILITSLLAVVIGLGALRVQGLLLAVSTLAFGLAAMQYLYRQPILSGDAIGTVQFARTDFLGIDLSSQRSFYWFSLGVLVVAVILVSRLRGSGVGRTTIAVRDNPARAASYTVPPGRTKLKTFALSGGLAATGGILLAAAIGSVPNDRFFTVEDSFLLVAMVVIGGLGSVSGALLGALWVVGLPTFFPDNDLVPLLASSLGLLVLLLYLPGGLTQVAFGVRDLILARAADRLGPAPATGVRQLPATLGVSRARAATDRPALSASEIVVRFGGVHAVDGATIVVGSGEIVGLIGTNGAGKSTLMNAIGGFVPASGRVQLDDVELTGTSPVRRAEVGLGRTFQAATLFPELTVREVVSVALEARGRTGMLSTALWLPGSVRAERAKRSEADELIDFLGLGRYADTYVASLSTGTRRIVELAGLLALDAKVLCLDEPTAGVAQRETEAFAPLLVEIRRQLDAAMLVIEHDMPMIMSISDRVYCLELGRVIAEGAPEQVRNDPLVVASYLGTDERAIARSGDASRSKDDRAELPTR